MKLKRHSPEQIIRKLRTAEQLLNQGQAVADVCRALEVAPALPPLAASVRRDVGEVGWRPHIELFSSLPEAKLLAEQHRIEYNANRPHSALQGRTPLEVLQQWKAA